MLLRIKCTVALFFCLFLLGGCKQYYLSIAQEWIDGTYLASSYVGTPDPLQKNPPTGQMLIVSWRIPESVFQKKPFIRLDLLLWDYTTRSIEIPIEHRMDFATYRLLDEEYKSSGGILSFKGEIVEENGEIFREWRHQLWVNLITLEDN